MRKPRLPLSAAWHLSDPTLLSHRKKAEGWEDCHQGSQDKPRFSHLRSALAPKPFFICFGLCSKTLVASCVERNVKNSR